jgi:hypothetical protein
MNMRRLKVVSFAAIIATVGFVACKDDFNEEDFLKLQDKLAQEKQQRDSSLAASLTEAAAQDYLNALNEAGDLMGVSILLRENNEPVAGATVTFNGSSQEVPPTNGRVNATFSAQTDASGVAVFERVPIGRHSIRITKTGYLAATALVDFGTPPSANDLKQITTTVNGITKTTFIAPEKRSENISVPLFSNDAAAGKVATVRGKITIETDLTNLAPEIPQNLTIQANLRNALNNVISVDGSASIYSYAIADGGIGTAAVNNTTGEYSITLPALANGLSGVSFIIPELIADQTIAINGADDGSGNIRTLANGPERRTNVPARWFYNVDQFGNVSTHNTSGLVTVSSAKVIFPEPAASGRGFVPTYTAVSRSIETGTYGDDGDNEEAIGGTTLRLTSRGSGFTSAPAVAFSGTGTVATTSLRGFVSGASVSAGGTGYPASTQVVLEFVEIASNGTTINGLGMSFSSSVTTTAGGALPTGAVTIPTSGYGYVGSNPFFTSAGISGFGVRVRDANTLAIITPTTAATFDVTRTTEVNAVHVTTAGKYSAAPTLTISGGGGTGATAVIAEYRTQFDIALPAASAITVPYKVTPSSFAFVFPSTSVSNGFTQATALVDLITSLGSTSVASSSFLGNLTTDGTNLVPRASAAGFTFRTSSSWAVAPTLQITDRTRTKGIATVNINNTTGQVTGVTINTAPSGYDALSLQLEPMFAGAPGTGALIVANTTTDVNSKEVTLGSISVTSGGSGYRSNVNRNNQNPAIGGIPALKPGQTYVVNIELGTGERKLLVN